MNTIHGNEHEKQLELFSDTQMDTHSNCIYNIKKKLIKIIIIVLAHTRSKKF